MFHQHNFQREIGYWTLVLEDEIGLYVEGEVTCPITIYEIQDSLSGLSMGFYTMQRKMMIEEEGSILTEVDLREVSLVYQPMLPKARLEIV